MNLSIEGNYMLVLKATLSFNALLALFICFIYLESTLNIEIVVLT